MGFYPVECLSCHKPFRWFSGSHTQICIECEKPKKEEMIMNNETKETEYLNQIIKLQGDLISFLKAEVERLKVSSYYYGTDPLGPQNPIVGPGINTPNPFIEPYYQPTAPYWGTIQPIPTPPFTVTSTDPIVRADQDGGASTSGSSISFFKAAKNG